MIEGWFGSLLAADESPTADLYVAGTMAGGAIVRLGPTVFASAAARLVVRHGSGTRRLPGRARTLYLIDDDIKAGMECPFLPAYYRHKLRILEAPWLSRMQRHADLIVAGSAALAARLGGGAEVRVAAPCWSLPFAALDHHAANGPVDIAFLGSAVHRADLALVLPAIEAVLRAEPRARFHVSRRHRLRAPLARHPRVRRFPSGSWSSYRGGLAGRRFHIALYPLLDTAFNRARSPNKLIEHAVVGAAPVYSPHWPEVGRVADGRSGLVRANRPDAWAEAIRALIGDAAGRRALAEGAQALARRLNDPVGQRRFWREAMA